MQSVFYRLIKPAIAVVAVMLTACSSNNHREAERGFDYVEASSSSPLIIPAGVDAPEVSSLYAIPELDPEAQMLIAELVDIRSPAQVLPLVPGSRVDKTDDSIIYWIDLLQAQTADASNAAMVQAITEYIEYRDSRPLAVNAAAGIVQSDWLIDRQEVEKTFWFGTTTVEQYQRFAYEVDIKPHGRTAGLEVQFVDAKVYSEDELVDLELNDFVKQRLVIVELNRLIGFIAERHQALELQLKEEREAEMLAAMSEQERATIEDKSITLKLVEDRGLSNYLALASMDKTMARLHTVLPVLGFEISDFVENTGKLYVNYSRPDDESLARYGLNGLDFADGEYIFSVGSNGLKTQITLADEEGEVVSYVQVEALYPYFAILMKMGLGTTDTLIR